MTWAPLASISPHAGLSHSVPELSCWGATLEGSRALLLWQLLLDPQRAQGLAFVLREDKIPTVWASRETLGTGMSRERQWEAGEGSGMHPKVTAPPVCEPSCAFGALPHSCAQHQPCGVLQLLAMPVVAARLLLGHCCSSGWAWGGPGCSAGEEHDPMAGGPGSSSGENDGPMRRGPESTAGEEHDPMIERSRVQQWKGP